MGSCSNGPDEYGEWPCDPVENRDVTATCSVCNFTGPKVKKDSVVNMVTLEIHEATAYAGRPLQVSIGNGHHGYRIAGPKFTASGARLLRRIELTKRDADAMISYLREVEGDG